MKELKRLMPQRHKKTTHARIPPGGIKFKSNKYLKIEKKQTICLVQVELSAEV